MNGSTQYLVAVNITESGVYDLGNTTPNAVFSPLTERWEAGEGGKGGAGGEGGREREREEKWNCIKPPDLTTKYQEIQGTGEHVNDTTEIHSTTSRL